MNERKSLEGSFFENTKKPKKLVFLLHGYGDNGKNFILLSKFINNLNQNINFFAPNAPNKIIEQIDGRQWFNLYPNGINYNDAGPEEKKIIKNDCQNSLKLLKIYIDDLCSAYQLNYQDCFIIGFSQGAMMSFELGKYINKVFAGCVLLSGRILPSDKYNYSPFIDTPILISHGDNDEVLDIKYFKEACNILKNAGFIFENYLDKNNGHNISIKTLEIVKNFLKKNI